MDHIFICMDYNGEWKITDNRIWEWFGTGCNKGFVVDRSIKFHQLVNKVYEKIGVDRNLYEIEITHKVAGETFNKMAPSKICGDSDVEDLFKELYKVKEVIPLYVCVKKNNDKGKTKFVNDDDGDGNELTGNDVEFDCDDDVFDNGSFYDNYFGCHIIDQVPNDPSYVPNEDIPQSGEGIIGSNPTPDDIVHESGNNELQECDKVVEENNDVIENDIVVGGGQIIPYQHYDMFMGNVAQCNREASQDSGRHDGSNLKVGQHFVSKDELSYYLSIIAINGRFEMRTTKSNKSIKEVRCVSENCLWRVRATKMKDSHFFVIRQYHSLHSCSLMNRNANHRQASSRVIGSRVQGHFKNSKDPLNPKSLAGFMREEMKVQVSYWKAWKGKQWAQNLIRGTAKENFALLPSYCHMLKRANPCTVTHIELDLENKFKYFFMALGVAIRGFTYMRKVIGIDAAWIKTKHKGVLLVATTQDSEYHSYPIAWGLVDSENNTSWTWFLEKLKDLIPDSSDLCFVSDRHQSIEHAVRRVYVMASHGACYWHVKQNIKHRFKSAAGTKLYKKAAIAYRIEEFNKHFDQLRKTYPRVAKYLENDVKFSKWSRAHFVGNRYEVMTTNIVESVNNMMRKAREYPIIAMIDFIISTMGQWFFERRREACVVTTPLTPKREEILRKRWDEAGSLITLQLNENEYNVMCGELDAIVNLRSKSCTCKVFDIEKLSCIHAIAAAGKAQPQNTGELIYSMCSQYYTSEYWLLAYAETIYPVPPNSQWTDIPEDILAVQVIAPPEDKTIGRPRTNRIASKGEFLKKQYNCGACGQSGHNSQTCPQVPSDGRSTTHV
ncbi:uncharacterized protein LOC133039773 [Cannabis sativa]|uniref:uncharacterized protein LOC133039773 n=1 Tax=Cannabis sativa TaxID=3483 RepID=UPI0029C9C763|nr:uncharacterized protein LOC133039773 [Cannabis sativa]